MSFANFISFGLQKTNGLESSRQIYTKFLTVYELFLLQKLTAIWTLALLLDYPFFNAL